MHILTRRARSAAPLRLAVVLAVCAACALASNASASAATFTVNSTSDAALPTSTATTCPATCSLREAVQAADNAGGASTITLQPGDYQFSSALANPNSAELDNPALGDLDINTGVQLTITGAGAATTLIDANHLDRIFAVQSGASLSLSGVTLEHGAQPDDTATTGVPNSYSTEPGYGGAIYNDGSVSIDSSTLTDNTADDGGAVIYSDSGATATSITNSTVTGNASDDEGGVAYVTSGSITLANDQITHNSAGDDGGAIYDYENGHTKGLLSISGTSLTNNVSGSQGGAVYVDDAGNLSVSASTLTDNTTDGDQGGAIYDDDSGTIAISGSTLSGNNAGDDDGGAVYVNNSGLSTISNSTFDDDSAGDDEGGAVYLDGSDITLSGSTFDGDTGDQGGALFVEGSSHTATESITTSTFAANAATADEGGAIDDDEGNLILTDSTFTDNNSSERGGALYYDSGDGLTATNDTFDGNQAGEEGGAISFNESTSTGAIKLLNDTIARNTAYQGGGIYFDYDPTGYTIENTIVADNAAASTVAGSTQVGGEDCYFKATPYHLGAADVGGNIDSDGSCFSKTQAPTDQTGVDPLLGTPSSNGGAQLTDALLSGSPAIGKAVASACPTTDERGVPRPTACDSGAFQTAGADLAIAVSAASTVTEGSPLTYTITVTNNGPAPATGVSVSDALPAGTTYFSSSSSPGSCTGTTTVTCALGTLDSVHTGTTTAATITITVIPGTAGSLTNTATVSSTTADPVSTNNTASATTTVGAGPTVTVAGATTVTKIKPVVLTGVASQVTKKGTARLSAIVNPAGQATTWRFQISTTRKFGPTTRGGKLAAGTIPKGVVLSVKSLKPGKTYHFRIVATNPTGTSYGQTVTFKTPKAASKKKATTKKKAP